MKKGLIIAAVLLILVAAVVVLVACPKKDNHDTSETPESSADVSDEVSKEVEETSDVIDTSEPDISQEDTSEEDVSKEPEVSDPETSKDEETSKDDVLENTTATYTVKHWKQNVDGNAAAHDSTNYTLAYTETGEGEIGSYAVPKVKNYAGFTAPVLQEMEIAKTGTTVNYYYTRNMYTVTLNKGEGISSVSGAGTYLYGSVVSISATVAEGYEWEEWEGAAEGAYAMYTFPMPAFRTTYTAKADKVVVQQPDVSNPTEEPKTEEPITGTTPVEVVVGGDKQEISSYEEAKEVFSEENLNTIKKGEALNIDGYIITANGDGTFSDEYGVIPDYLLEAILRNKWCSHCGKRVGDGTDGTCVRYLRSTECYECGKHCESLECHTCDK